MKNTKTTTIKGFKAVDFMRKTRDEISCDITDMTFEQITKYLENRRKNLIETSSNNTST